MKKIINIIAGASVILLAASCDDFLNIRVEGTMPSSGVLFEELGHALH